MTKRYGVVHTFDGRISPEILPVRFRQLTAAKKERDRLSESAWFKVATAYDLLHSGSFRYSWRVFDYVDKKFVS